MRRVWLLSISAILLGTVGVFPRIFAGQTVVINDLLAETYIEDDSYDGEYYEDSNGTDGISDAAGSNKADADSTVFSDADNDLSYTKYSYKESSKKQSAKSKAGAEAAKHPATGHKVFIYNPRTLRWSVYDAQGNFVRSGHGSGGRHYCPDIRRGCRTPSGTYHIFSKAGPGFRSSRYPLPGGGAPMPYAMFFSKYYAIHGSNDVPGYNASHGCVRVYTSDAKWLNQNFLDNGSTVIIKSY